MHTEDAKTEAHAHCRQGSSLRSLTLILGESPTMCSMPVRVSSVQGGHGRPPQAVTSARALMSTPGASMRIYPHLESLVPVRAPAHWHQANTYRMSNQGFATSASCTM